MRPRRWDRRDRGGSGLGLETRRWSMTCSHEGEQIAQFASQTRTTPSGSMAQKWLLHAPIVRLPRRLARAQGEDLWSLRCGGLGHGECLYPASLVVPSHFHLESM